MTAPSLTGPPTGPSLPTPSPTPRALLWEALRTRRRDLTLASLFFSSHQLGEALVPVIVGAAVGNAVQNGTPHQLAGWLGLLAADFLLLSLSFRFGARAAKRAAQHTEHLARGRLTAAVLRPTGGVRMLPGELLSRAAGDAARVGVFARTVASTVAAVVVLLASTLLLVRISPPLGALVVAGTAGLLAAQHRLSATLRRTSTTEQARQADAAALAEDLVRGLRVLKGIGAARAVAADYARVSQDAVRAARRAASAEAALLSLGTAFTGLYLTAVALTGGWLALDGHLNLGEFIAALGLAQFVIGPMRVVAAARAGHARAIASTTRIHEVLNTPPAVPDAGTRGEATRAAAGDGGAADRTAGGAPGAMEGGPAGAGGGAPGAVEGDVAAGGVARVVGGGAVVGGTAAAAVGAELAGGIGVEPWSGLEFRGVPLPGGAVLDARVPGGSMTGLVCDGPAAAEAVTALLAREFDPAEGRVLLDGVDLAAFPLDALRATALVCPHEPALLPGTLGDNLGALSDGADATAEGARAALADQVVDATPHGTDTSVGDRGETLSGGQRQRVALARALAARSTILVLHDPTTAVDAATEHTIAARVRRARADLTTLVITNSPAWLARCTQIVHAHGEGGSARCDTGTHAALLATSAAYRRTVTR
ncbi:ABC transporter transmembrane domain-containing protein [Streptomyces sp. NPDC091279]|uniref:ABC transporter transmembrane domain-containing protein n=1 Tax=Streptomyces sp. NPDC091279 TaxID=3365983 RepID=UPI0037FD84DD